MKIADYVYGYRKAHKLSLREFADKCGCSHQYIAKLEKNEIASPTLEMIEKIASATGLSLQEFLALLDSDTIVDYSDFIYKGRQGFSGVFTGTPDEYPNAKIIKDQLDSNYMSSKTIGKNIFDKLTGLPEQTQEAVFMLLGFDKDEITKMLFYINTIYKEAMEEK